MNNAKSTQVKKNVRVQMKPETECETRRDLIDVMLKKAGWDPKDITKVIQEPDTKQSDFEARDYKTRSETLKTVAEKAYADYLLLDGSGSPLAVIEAKRTTKDPVLGQEQAEEYADDIKKQTGKDVFVFLTNGFEIWFWNRPHESLRMVKGYHSLDDLERIRFQNASKKNLRDIPIDPKIVDRPYQLEAVKRVTEGIEKGRRKFRMRQSTKRSLS
jgi:type I restriction enzyme R subunit